MPAEIREGSLVVQELVAGAAEDHEIAEIVPTTTGARNAVMDFQEPGAAAAGRLAALPVPPQDFTPAGGRDGVVVWLAGNVDAGVALDPLQVARGQGFGAAPGFDRGGGAGGALVHVDLVVGAGVTVPPGGLFVCEQGGEGGQQNVGPIPAREALLLVELFH